ncbi:winged helix-turn-helix transcriptional regulator [Bordetella petrii]|uniref:Transcriptional regulator, AsnC-family n=1 Tax=Bordetella petrii (strain ATCC BAA-461 / DSM 12804 / CCUG 43448 / CIP 107267 / Se-1111R) TaxID=340100 RepID=A9IC61_BORPD|nr:winged helix-turn-helix transcriptional regulator [Bordetella petrii]CAP41527.1 transcriptional regulator, AsnC-family [Bordetella petrii]
MTPTLDKIDRKILNALQDDGRLQNVELAKIVGLSPSPCLRRVKLLEDAGYIQRYAAILNPSMVDAALTVFVRVWLTGQDEKTVEAFTREVALMDQITECHLMAGDCDFLLRVVVSDLAAYREFQVKHLTVLPIVQSVKTEIPMQVVKSTSKIAL